MTSRRRLLPTELAVVARSGVPIGFLILAAAFPQAKLLVLVRAASSTSRSAGSIAGRAPQRTSARCSMLHVVEKSKQTR